MQHGSLILLYMSHPEYKATLPSLECAYGLKEFLELPLHLLYVNFAIRSPYPYTSRKGQ